MIWNAETLGVVENLGNSAPKVTEPPSAGMGFLTGMLGGVVQLATGTPQPITPPPITQATPGSGGGNIVLITAIVALVIFIIALYFVLKKK